MPVTTFTDEEISAIASEVTKQLLPTLLNEFKQEQLPPLLTRQEFMKLADIGSTKCNELFNRADFPVNRELGHPRVLTKDFFKWVSKTNQNSHDINLQYPYKII